MEWITLYIDGKEVKALNEEVADIIHEMIRYSINSIDLVQVGGKVAAFVTIKKKEAK